jgi:hypothetical protein
MTSNELQYLKNYLTKLTHVGYVKRDPQAAEAIAAAFACQIDAPYLAVQRCLQLEQALAAAQARIAQLEQAAARKAIPLNSTMHLPAAAAQADRAAAIL